MDFTGGQPDRDTRRGILRAGPAVALGFAGCLGGSANDSPADGSPTSPDDRDTPTSPTPTPNGPAGGIESGDGVGSAFLADNGEMNLYAQTPQAAYDPAAHLTVHAYQSTDSGATTAPKVASDGDAYAVAFDHETRCVLGPSRIGFNPLRDGDTHGVPALTIDGDGYVHVFFGCHGGWNTHDLYPAFEYARSAEPHSIEAWVHPPSGESGSGNLPTPPGTYPCPAYNPTEDAVYVLYRAGQGDAAYPSHVYGTLARSGDGGETWTDVNEGVLDFSDAPGRHYDAYVKDLGAWAGRLHLTWNISEGDRHGQSRHSVYHAAYNPDTGRMETTSGGDLGESVTWPQPIEGCLVKDTHLAGNEAGGTPGGTTIMGFNHGYDPEGDTAYIPASYRIGDDTSVVRLYSYEGISEGSGEWTESDVIVEESPSSPWTFLRINEAGEPEVQAHGPEGGGVWVPTDDGFEHRSFDRTDGIVVSKPVERGRDEFGWVGRRWITRRGSERGRHLHVYAVGEGLAGAAMYTRPPRNLRVASQSDGSVTIDWDEGLAGPASLQRYDVYVDGEQRVSVTDHPKKQTAYPKTFHSLDLDPGEHELWVTLTTRDGTESGASNVVDVSV
jgi:hypothetical protein